MDLQREALERGQVDLRWVLERRAVADRQDGTAGRGGQRGRGSGRLGRPCWLQRLARPTGRGRS
eukprot:4263285-Alexandrium_andersonii.AAC.1